ncbi:MAG: hypothetical protein JSW34_07205 [Candidatus Zixiibacteriota bacterium]|nr:MAG: hypothetical protein JSW34_07205 [candidate division Zixibacteria bacterium]
MLRSGKVLIMIVLAFGLLAVSALAQSPPTLMYQGKLTDANIDPITTATEVTFRVWDAQDGSGVELWAEVQSVTPNAQGVFTVELGAVTPFPPGLFDGSVRFLSMTVTGDDEMLPRQPITSVPYSLSAQVPGFANSFKNYYNLSSSSLMVPDTLEVLVPGPGHLIVEATGFMYQGKQTSLSSWVEVHIDTMSTGSDFWAYAYNYLSSSLIAGSYYDNFAITRVVPADTAGTYTFYLTTYRSANASSASVSQLNFKAVYYPSHIGTEAPIPNPPSATGTRVLPEGLPEEMRQRIESEGQ